MRYVAAYCIVVGMLMFAQWAFFLSSGQVPELKTEPVRIGMHLAAEGVTALALVSAGIGLLNRRAWAKPVSIFALGMLTYTVIASPGYFAQQQNWPIVGMFAVLLVLALACLQYLLAGLPKSKRSKGNQRRPANARR